MTSPETQKMIDNLLGNQVQIQASLSIVVEELRHQRQLIDRAFLQKMTEIELLMEGIKILLEVSDRHEEHIVNLLKQNETNHSHIDKFQQKISTIQGKLNSLENQIQSNDG